MTATRPTTGSPTSRLTAAVAPTTRRRVAVGQPCRRLTTTDDTGSRRSTSPPAPRSRSPSSRRSSPAIVAARRSPSSGARHRDIRENANYDGVWHLHVAITLDGGQTWSTPTDVTRDDPVQRGWTGAKFIGSCGRRHRRPRAGARRLSRRLRVRRVRGGPDGTPADSNNSSYGVARQVARPRMFSAFDPQRIR